jgi:hypothetical protein
LRLLHRLAGSPLRTFLHVIAVQSYVLFRLERVAYVRVLHTGTVQALFGANPAGGTRETDRSGHDGFGDAEDCGTSKRCELSRRPIGLHRAL